MSNANSPSVYSPDPNQESPRSTFRQPGSGHVSPEDTGEINFSTPGARYNQQRDVQPQRSQGQPPVQQQANYQLQQQQQSQYNPNSQYQQQRPAISAYPNQSNQSLRSMAEEEHDAQPNSRPNSQGQQQYPVHSRPTSTFSQNQRSSSPSTLAGPRYVASPPPISGRPLSEHQQPQPSRPTSASGPPSRGPPTIAGEPLHDLERAIGLLKGSKFYAEGFLMKRVEVAADGKSHPNSQEAQWSKWFVQLSGTIASLWNAKEMEEAARENRTVPPQYLNLSDAFLHPFPPSPRDGPTPTPFQFALNSAGLNRLLFCAPSQQSLNMWVNAIRLAGWERSRCNEIYTGALLGLREPKPLGWIGFEGGVDSSKEKFQGWLKVRLPGDTEWRKVWTIVLKGESSNASVASVTIKKTRRSSILGSFGRKGPVDTPIIEDLPGGGSLSTVAFYSTKPVKKEQPLCIAQHLFYAAAIYPESDKLVDVSSLFKIEGTFLNPADGYKLGWGVGGRAEKQGFALVMHEEGDAMAMLQWIVGLADAFKLYGRPRGFSFDPRDPSSLYFALPVGPHRDRQFLDRELVDSLDINESRPRAIRAVFHNILFDRMRGVRTAPPPSNPTPPPVVQAPVDQDPPKQLRAVNTVNTDNDELEEDQGPSPNRFQPRGASPRRYPVLPPIGERENGSESSPQLNEPPTFAAPRSSVASEENQRREDEIPGARSLLRQEDESSGARSPLRPQDQSDSTDVLENYVNYLSSDVSREPSPPPVPAPQPFRSSPFAVSPLDAFKSNPAPNYSRPTPTSRATVDTVADSELTHVTYLPADQSAPGGFYAVDQASGIQKPVNRPTADTVVSTTGSSSGPVSDLTHVSYFPPDRSDPTFNAISTRSLQPGAQNVTDSSQEGLNYVRDGPNLNGEASMPSSRREEMRTETTVRMGGGQDSLGAISAVSASDYGEFNSRNSPITESPVASPQPPFSSTRVPASPLPSSSPVRPLPVVPRTGAEGRSPSRSPAPIPSHRRDGSQDDDLTMHSDLLAALDFTNATQSPPKPLPRIVTNYSSSPPPIPIVNQEPPSPIDEEYTSPPPPPVPRRTPSPDTRGSLNPGSEAPQAFPSTFAKNKRAEDRIAAAALAQQAQQEALSRPGRPAKVVKSKGKQRAWVDSDEDEEEEENDDEDSDAGGVGPQQMASRQASSSDVRSMADRGSRFSPTPPNGQHAQYSSQDSGTRDRQSYYDNGPESYQAASSESPADPANTRPIKPFVSPHGLLHAGIIEKEERSARAIENEARMTGGPLLSIPSKPPPPQTGLVGAITSHQREKERTGGMGRALTDQQRERKLAELRQKQLDDFQRQQLQQQQMQMQAMQQYQNPMFMNPMMNPWMMGGMGGYPGMGMSSPAGLPPTGAPAPGPMSGQGPPGQMPPGSAPDPQMLQQQALQQQAMMAAQMAYQQAMAQFAPQFSQPSLPVPGAPPSLANPVAAPNPAGAMPGGSYFARVPPAPSPPPFGFGQPPYPPFSNPYTQAPYNPYAAMAPMPPMAPFGQYPAGGSDSLGQSQPHSRQTSASYEPNPEGHHDDRT